MLPVAAFICTMQRVQTDSKLHSLYILLVRRKVHLTTQSKDRIICGAEHPRGFSVDTAIFPSSNFVLTVICSQHFLLVAIYLEPCIGWKVVKIKIKIVKHWFLFNILLYSLFFFRILLFCIQSTAIHTISRILTVDSDYHIFITTEVLVYQKSSFLSDFQYRVSQFVFLWYQPTFPY